jgi:alcohol/geraniol dehydrogenase (NADP+)
MTTTKPSPSADDRIHAFAANNVGETLQPHEYAPKALDSMGVEIQITHCGMCHTDLHLINNDFGLSTYPLVPGHEIVGVVSQVGGEATGLKVGRRVGVGWLAGACLVCEQCTAGRDNLCPKWQPTCVGREGGYATHIRVDSRFAFPIPDDLPSEFAAPLLCGGITVFGPLLRHAVAGPARLGVIGIGGLGHVALQFGRALGCHVIAFSSSASKAAEAKRFGADDFVATAQPGALSVYASSCDFLLCTVSADLPWADYLQVLRPGGKLCIVGVPDRDLRIPVLPFIIGQQSVVSGCVGSRSEIQIMLEFSARHRIRPQVELFPMNQANRALDRLRANQMRYRGVLTN